MSQHDAREGTNYQQLATWTCNLLFVPLKFFFFETSAPCPTQELLSFRWDFWKTVAHFHQNYPGKKLQIQISNPNFSFYPEFLRGGAVCWRTLIVDICVGSLWLVEHTQVLFYLFKLHLFTQKHVRAILGIKQRFWGKKLFFLEFVTNIPLYICGLENGA